MLLFANMNINPLIQDIRIAQEYASYPSAIQKKLFTIRTLIFKTAASIPAVALIEETLKWGEPSYLTALSKSGSTIRLAWKKSKPDQFGIYVNCKTNIIETIKGLYGNELSYEKHRAVIFHKNETLPIDIIEHLITIALTYHLKKIKD